MRVTTYRVELDADLHNVLVKESSHNYPEKKIRTPYMMAEMMNTLYGLNKKAEEYMYMVALNTKNRVLGVFEISHGTVKSALCQPREILVRALLCGASGLILLHNHPSGETGPSKEDVLVYERIKKACQLVGVDLHDHIIVGEDRNYYSFIENNLDGEIYFKGTARKRNGKKTG